MNAAPAPPPPAPPWWRRAEVWLALAIALYGFGYLLGYAGAPIGRAPQLDARENLGLAEQIARGTLPREPFYRAMLYPALLALPLKLGLPAGALPSLAAAFGLLGHFAATLAVARLAARVWAGPPARGAAAVAAALWGLNPVALFYAADVHDTALALALFLWGLVYLARPGGRAAAGGGVLLALAVAARPNYFPVLFVAPLARAWLAGRRRPARGDFWSWAGAAAPLLALGGLQFFWAGEFRVLPWQGAYNLYSANRPGANGRYFVQQLYLADLPPGANPARAESEILYARDTGARPPFDRSAMEAHWRARAREAIAATPAAWLEVLLLKLVYALNDFDQYNNKTYAWHQRASPWLRWNPLGWGVLAVLAAAALVRGAQERRVALAGVLLAAAAYGAGLLMYYASGRFRLPLAPLLGVLAGGWAGAGAWCGEMRLRRRPAWLRAAGQAALVAAVVAFVPWFGARDESTFIQDELLVANAAAELAEDRLALEHALRALSYDASRPDARRLALLSQLNLSLEDPRSADWRGLLPLVEGLELRDAPLALAAGAACWKSGERERAERIWARGAERFGAQSPPGQALRAAAALRGGGPPPADPTEAAWYDYLRAR